MNDGSRILIKSRETIKNKYRPKAGRKEKKVQKPLTDDQKQKIIQTAIFEFAEYGFNGANINIIAEKAGVSVGVIYKYFTDKETLFTACVKGSLGYMDGMFDKAEEGEGNLMEFLEQLIALVQREARVHPEYYKLYLQLTVSDMPKQSKEVVSLVESSSARLYRNLFLNAKNEGLISKDVDSRLFSFYFDNLIMMLHFAYSCDYYEERFKIYCGKEITSEEKDEFVREEMMKFLAGAFGYNY